MVRPGAPHRGGLTSATAASAPGPDLNAPWRVLGHLRTGFALWARWLAGEPAEPADFGATDEWAPVTDPSPAAWAALVADAIAEEARLRRAVADMPEASLLAVDPRFGEAPLAVIVGLITHTGYHAGELRTLASLAR